MTKFFFDQLYGHFFVVYLFLFVLVLLFSKNNISRAIYLYSYHSFNKYLLNDLIKNAEIGRHSERFQAQIQKLLQNIKFL